MLKIEIITDKKIKPTDYKNAVSEYVKRLSETAKINFKTSVKSISKNPSECIFNIDYKGKSLSSEDFADMIENLKINGISKLIFNFTDNKADDAYDLSLCHVDLSEELTVILLLEQLYRAYRINSGGKYHK